MKNEIIKGYEKYIKDKIEIKIATNTEMKYNYENIGNLLHTLINVINKKDTNENYLLLKNISNTIQPIFCNRMGITRDIYKRLNIGFEYSIVNNFKNCPLNGKFPRFSLIKRVLVEFSNRCTIYNDSLSFTNTHKLLFIDLKNISIGIFIF
jgi:hypothetical protein